MSNPSERGFLQVTLMAKQFDGDMWNEVELCSGCFNELVLLFKEEGGRS